MIPRITHGSDAAGPVRYLLGRGRHDEHALPQVIAAAPGMSAPIGTPLTGEEARSLAFDLDLPHRLYGTEVPVKIKQSDGTTLRQDAYVWHLSLSLAPEGPTLSDEHWAEVVTGAIHRMGFDADPGTGRAGCPGWPSAMGPTAAAATTSTSRCPGCVTMARSLRIGTTG